MGLEMTVRVSAIGTQLILIRSTVSQPKMSRTVGLSYVTHVVKCNHSVLWLAAALDVAQGTGTCGIQGQR